MTAVHVDDHQRSMLAVQLLGSSAFAMRYQYITIASQSAAAALCLSDSKQLTLLLLLLPPFTPHA
jgi:hypothetical protein